MTFLRNNLSAAASNSPADADPKLASLREELTAASDTIGKLRADVKTGSDQTDYNRQQASDYYSRGFDERPEADSNHRRQLLVREKGMRDLESKLSATGVAETQTRERNTKLAVRLADKDT